MSVTVLVVTHNSEATIARCLESVPVRSTERVVVVDNASTDATRELVRERFPQVEVLALAENVGFGAANNRGEQAASGDQLLLLNPDAWLDPGSLEILSSCLRRSPDVAAVAPQLRFPDGRLQYTWHPECGVVGEAIQRWRNRRGGRWAHHRLEALLRPLVGPGWLTAACLLLRREAFRAVGGFDEGYFLYFEDVDLCRRLGGAGWRMLKVADAGAVHVGSVALRDEEAAGGPSRATLEYRRSQLRYYRKHRPRWERNLLRRRLKRRFDVPGASEVLRRGIREALREDLAAQTPPRGGGGS